MRWWKGILGVAGVVALLVGAQLVYASLPRWSGPLLNAEQVDGQETCWRILSIFPRALRHDDGRVLETEAIYWTDVIIVDYPAERVVDHGLADEVSPGDVVCGAAGSQEWYYAPTGEKVGGVCDKRDWPDCPGPDRLSPRLRR